MDNGKSPHLYSLEEQVTALIDQLDAYINHYHGGNVELVSFDGKIVKVRLGGACQGCPLSPSTMNGWVKGTMHQFFPDIIVQEVE